MDDRIRKPTPLPCSGDDQPPAHLNAEQVYLQYGPRVYNMAQRMVRNETDAEDVAQDVFMHVVRKLPTFRGESAFPTWLHRVTVNAALAHRRRHALRVTNPLAEVCDSNPLSSPPAFILDAEQRQVIERAIASLPDNFRDILVLADVEQMPNGDIAAALGLSVGAVKSRLHRARLLLRDRLAPHFELAAEVHG